MSARFFTVFAFYLAAILMFAGSAYATAPIPAPPSPLANPVPESCDPEFYQVMRSSAWLQAERQNETAERLILKGDSVLQYSCYNPSIISESIGINTFVSPEYADTMLRVLEVSSLNYLEGGNPGNFEHAPGGGSLAATLNYSPCQYMQVVWDQLKCRNFDILDFRTFAEVRDDDRRIYPEPCNVAGRAALWQTHIDLASPPAAPSPAPAGGVDLLVPYNDMITNTVAPACGQPIPTGVMRGIMGRDGPDAVCPVPGCYYTGNVCAPS